MGSKRISSSERHLIFTSEEVLGETKEPPRHYVLSLDHLIATFQRNISQYCWRLHSTKCFERLATLLPRVGLVATCCVLIAQFQKWPNLLSEQHPTRHNSVAKRAQHVANRNVAISCVEMSRSSDQSFSQVVLFILESKVIQVTKSSSKSLYLLP